MTELKLGSLFDGIGGFPLAATMNDIRPVWASEIEPFPMAVTAFMCVHPVGRNVLGEQFERALPASSVANLFPFNYSGKTDKNGFYIGRDKFGSNVIVDFNQRADDKTKPIS